MASYIVTGGAGFIGSNLVRALNRRGETDILIVDHRNHPAKERNLGLLNYRRFMDKTAFRESLHNGEICPATAVFHLGACSDTTEPDESYLADNNVAYSQELCRWALEHGVRFIYASSAAAYGDGQFGYSDDEELSRQLVPLNPYGRSKLQFDLWLLEQGLFDRVVGLRYFNVYGPGEDHKGEMRSLVRKAFDDVRISGVIRLFRSYQPGIAHGEQTRDFIFVDDAVDETLFFADHPSLNGLYNCGTGQPRSWNDLAAALFAALELPLKIEYIEMPAVLRARYQTHTKAATEKLRRAGFVRPFQPVEAGVALYVRQLLMPATNAART